MFDERTAIGLDVHARSVRAAALDTATGEIVPAKLPPGNATVIEWIGQQQQRLGPLAAVYEAGPTGFGLARALEGAGIRCVVAAPSKIIRPAGERVKTDARDALLLARLLRMDELTAVRVPTAVEEDARDLVRARDDARTDLLAAGHRLSKLLLRHGIVHEGTTWTRARRGAAPHPRARPRRRWRRQPGRVRCRVRHGHAHAGASRPARPDHRRDVGSQACAAYRP